MSLRKSTSPRRTSRHNPVQPASQSTAQPWIAASLYDIGGPQNNASIDVFGFKYALAPLVVVLGEGYRLAPGAGIFVVGLNGEIIQPTSIVVNEDPLSIVITADLSALVIGDIAQLVIEPNQNRISSSDGTRIAGIIYQFTVPA